MRATVFKNNNVRIRREPSFDGDATATLAGLLEAMCADPDAPDVIDVEECHPHQLVTLEVNGAPRRYFMDEADAERFASGRTVSLAYLDDAPLFTLPGFRRCGGFELGGRAGTLYVLCGEPSADEREAMEAAGCSVLASRSQYAPEIRGAAVFVPAGTPFEHA